MSFSNYLENKLLDHFMGGPAYTKPATLYFSLHTDDPGETGANECASANGYARKGVTNNDTNLPAAASGEKLSGTDITFAVATGSWGTATHWGCWDAASGGNFLLGGALGSSQAITTNNIYSIPAGGLSVTLD